MTIMLGLSESSQMVGCLQTLSVMLSQWSINMTRANLEMVVSMVLEGDGKNCFSGNGNKKMIIIIVTVRKMILLL